MAPFSFVSSSPSYTLVAPSVSTVIFFGLTVSVPGLDGDVREHVGHVVALGVEDLVALDRVLGGAGVSLSAVHLGLDRKALGQALGLNLIARQGLAAVGMRCSAARKRHGLVGRRDLERTEDIGHLVVGFLGVLPVDLVGVIRGADLGAAAGGLGRDGVLALEALDLNAVRGQCRAVVLLLAAVGRNRQRGGD